MYVCLQVHMHVWASMWRPKVDAGSHSWLLSTLFSEVEALSGTLTFTNKSHLAVLLVWGGGTVAGITDKPPCPLDISVGVGKLNFLSLTCVTSGFCCLFVLFFLHWTISLVPKSSFMLYSLSPKQGDSKYESISIRLNKNVRPICL